MPEAATRDGHAGGTVLAFDFGEKRIGVAVGEWGIGQAHPLATIACEANAGRFAAIAALIAEWRPLALVVGRPLALDGRPHAMTARCERFARQLQARFALPVEHADERLSSCAAQEQLREAGCRGRRMRSCVDTVAAQVILQGYFDAQAADLPFPVLRTRFSDQRQHADARLDTS